MSQLKSSDNGRMSFIPACFVIGVFFFVALPSAANENGPSEIIEKFETQVYGHPSRGGIQQRLNNLERTLWGTDQHWSVIESVDQIQELLNCNGFDGEHHHGAEYKSFETRDPSDTKQVPSLSNADSIFRQALEAYEQGQMKMAEELFRRTIQLDPSQADAHYSLGSILEKERRYKEALTCYEAVLQLDSNDVEAATAVKSMKRKLEEEIAQENATCDDDWVEDNVEEILPGDTVKNRSTTPNKRPEVSHNESTSERELIAEATRQYKAGNHKAAIKNLTRYLSEHPDDANAKYALARSYQAVGDLNSAKYYFEEALEDDPHNPKFSKAVDETRMAKRRTGIPDYAAVKPSSGGIVPMKPETGERVYKFGKSGLGTTVRYALAGAAIGAGIGSMSNRGMGMGALEGGLVGLALGLIKW